MTYAKHLIIAAREIDIYWLIFMLSRYGRCWITDEHSTYSSSWSVLEAIISILLVQYSALEFFRFMDNKNLETRVYPFTNKVELRILINYSSQVGCVCCCALLSKNSIRIPSFYSSHNSIAHLIEQTLLFKDQFIWLENNDKIKTINRDF